MTVVHNHPHPKAHQVVKPSNPEILKKFGMVRIEDWSDRILQLTWRELVGRNYAPAMEQNLLTAVADDQIVACHTLTTGERVLLHDDWLQ